MAYGFEFVPSTFDSRNVGELVCVENRATAEFHNLERNLRIDNAVSLHPARIAASFDFIHTFSARVVLRCAVGVVQNYSVVDKLPKRENAAYEFVLFALPK